MQTQHTPGPWHIGKRQPSSSFYVYGPQGEEIADCDPLTQFEGVNRANARLIAAAPELLEALEGMTKAFKRLSEKYEPDNTDAEWLAHASEAINKAKGA